MNGMRAFSAALAVALLAAPVGAAPADASTAAEVKPPTASAMSKPTVPMTPRAKAGVRQFMNPLMKQTTHEIMMPAAGQPMPPPRNGARVAPPVSVPTGRPAPPPG